MSYQACLSFIFPIRAIVSQAWTLDPSLKHACNSNTVTDLRLVPHNFTRWALASPPSLHGTTFLRVSIIGRGSTRSTFHTARICSIPLASRRTCPPFHSRTCILSIHIRMDVFPLLITDDHDDGGSTTIIMNPKPQTMTLTRGRKTTPIRTSGVASLHLSTRNAPPISKSR